MHIASKLQYGESRKKNMQIIGVWLLFSADSLSSETHYSTAVRHTPAGVSTPPAAQPSDNGRMTLENFHFTVCRRPAYFVPVRREKKTASVSMGGPPLCAGKTNLSSIANYDERFITVRVIYHGVFFWFGCFPRFSLPVRFELWHFFCGLNLG